LEVGAANYTAGLLRWVDLALLSVGEKKQQKTTKIPPRVLFSILQPGISLCICIDRVSGSPKPLQLPDTESGKAKEMV
jgi:hypothetical protein